MLSTQGNAAPGFRERGPNLPTKAEHLTPSFGGGGEPTRSSPVARRAPRGVVWMAPPAIRLGSSVKCSARSSAVVVVPRTTVGSRNPSFRRYLPGQSRTLDTALRVSGSRPEDVAQEGNGADRNRHRGSGKRCQLLPHAPGDRRLAPRLQRGGHRLGHRRAQGQRGRRRGGRRPLPLVILLHEACAEAVQRVRCIACGSA